MDKHASNIIVQYDDGTAVELTKGVVANFKEDTMHLDMLNFERYDMVRLTYGLMATLDQMGLTEDLMKFTQGIPLPDEVE